MSSSHQFAIMSLQSLEENYHEVCHNYLLYSAIAAVVKLRMRILSSLNCHFVARSVKGITPFTGWELK